MQATWTPINLTGLPANLISRSSHCLSVVGRRAYIFGGELKPRTPIGNEVLVVDLDGKDPSRVVKPASAAQAWPIARVGASMVAHAASKALYLWGGRGGKDMSPIETRRDDGEQHTDDMWRFDTVQEKWTKLQTQRGTASDFPQDRSYHTAAIAGDRLFVHAGCPASGRLASLESIELGNLSWSTMPSAPEPGRGGTVLTAIEGPTGAKQLIRWGGFCGYELGGPLDIFDIKSATWTSSEVPLLDISGQPYKRSVHGLVPYPSGAESISHSTFGEAKAVAIMFMGEGEGAPKELGHDGAGKFLDDVYALLRSSSEPSTFAWLRIEPKVANSSIAPQPRGWFAFDATDTKNGLEIIAHGGLNEANERIGDAWRLSIGHAAV
ncbi:hypothetical protein IE81DRAFT_24529 [Ceraceosorus guamensis]|uniref:Galactose oxidase n=1 Tax=Ceraceosorus guamensis TaxID=1522189 RepID=A0A316VQ56_9BASI|nr:hypothetical protein IE81DRAFT_24529 [Ceraceosorus guamensis]PWN39460.1 hypothetical protein IE81DRAFT_24529 [Ceraceosorus guamensis]